MSRHIKNDDWNGIMEVMMDKDVIKAPTILSMVRDWADLLSPAYWADQIPLPTIPRGDGHTVLFIPDMIANDLITSPPRKYFKALGYNAVGWKLGANIGPTKRIMNGLERQLFDYNESSGRRVTLVGKSLGGLIAREIAKKHPDRVRRLVLNCSPLRHPVISHKAPIMYALRSFFDPSIPSDFEQLSQPAPVPTTAFHTKMDGILAWQSCMEFEGPNVENIELPKAYHCTASMNKIFLTTLAERLACPDRA
mgnify:CR=1 FL=1